MARRGGREGLKRALDNSLAADVNPGARGHLAIHREAEFFEALELVEIRPVPDEVGIRDQDAGRLLVGAEYADRLAGLDQQGFEVLERFQRAHDGLERWPVARRLTRPAVHDKIVRALRD